MLNARVLSPGAQYPIEREVPVDARLPGKSKTPFAYIVPLPVLEEVMARRPADITPYPPDYTFRANPTPTQKSLYEHFEGSARDRAALRSSGSSPPC